MSEENNRVEENVEMPEENVDIPEENVDIPEENVGIPEENVDIPVVQMQPALGYTDENNNVHIVLRNPYIRPRYLYNPYPNHGISRSPSPSYETDHEDGYENQNTATASSQNSANDADSETDTDVETRPTISVRVPEYPRRSDQMQATEYSTGNNIPSTSRVIRNAARRTLRGRMPRTAHQPNRGTSSVPIPDNTSSSDEMEGAVDYSIANNIPSTSRVIRTASRRTLRGRMPRSAHRPNRGTSRVIRTVTRRTLRERMPRPAHQPNRGPSSVPVPTNLSRSEDVQAIDYSTANNMPSTSRGEHSGLHQDSRNMQWAMGLISLSPNNRRRPRSPSPSYETEHEDGYENQNPDTDSSQDSANDADSDADAEVRPTIRRRRLY